MKKKLLLFLLVAASLLGGGYALTQALFTDTEESGTNTITAGTLNMTVGGVDGTAFDNIVVNNIGVDGTVSGQKEWTIINTGSVPGTLKMQLNDIVNIENGCNEPEAKADTTCATPGNGEGELGGVITTAVQLDRDGEAAGASYTSVLTSTLATANQAAYATQWNTNAGVVRIPAGGQVKVRMDWANDPATYGNEIQSDSLTFGVQFDLTQVTPVQTPQP